MADLKKVVIPSVVSPTKFKAPSTPLDNFGESVNGPGALIKLAGMMDSVPAKGNWRWGIFRVERGKLELGVFC